MERFHIWVKYTGVWGIISPMKWVVHNELTQLRKCDDILRKFTLNLQEIYTDISAINMTFRNSVWRFVGDDTVEVFRLSVFTQTNMLSIYKCSFKFSDNLLTSYVQLVCLVLFKHYYYFDLK